VVQACVENYNATSLVTWGVSDANSWRGSGCGCLIWNTSYQAKAEVYSAVQAAFSGGDAAIAAKRKEFMALSPQALLNYKVSTTALKKNETQQRFTVNNSICSYYLPVDRDMNVQVIDILGKVAVGLNLGRQKAGTHTVSLTHRRLPAGLYFARVRSGNQFTCVPFTRLN
jgi:hypothetical protein